MAQQNIFSVEQGFYHKHFLPEADFNFNQNVSSEHKRISMWRYEYEIQQQIAM